MMGVFGSSIGNELQSIVFLAITSGTPTLYSLFFSTEKYFKLWIFQVGIKTANIRMHINTLHTNDEMHLTND